MAVHPLKNKTALNTVAKNNISLRHARCLFSFLMKHPKTV
jgi:hypothetical protein